MSTSRGCFDVWSGLHGWRGFSIECDSCKFSGLAAHFCLGRHWSLDLVSPLQHGHWTWATVLEVQFVPLRSDVQLRG